MTDSAALRYYTERFERSRDLREAFGGMRGAWDERRHPRARDGKFARGMNLAPGVGTGLRKGIRTLRAGAKQYGRYRRAQMKAGDRVGLASTALSTAGATVGTMLGSAAGLALGPAGMYGGGMLGGGMGAKLGNRVGKRLDRYLPGITGAEAMGVGLATNMVTGRLLTKSGVSKRIFLRAGHAGRKVRRGGEDYAVRVLRSRLNPAQRARVLKKMGPWLTAAKSVKKDVDLLYRTGYRIRRHPVTTAKKAARAAGRVFKRATAP